MNFRKEVISLAKHLGAETEYLDASGKTVEPSLETLLIFIKTMGFEIHSEKDLEEAKNILKADCSRKTPVLLTENRKIRVPFSDQKEAVLTDEDGKVVFTTCKNKFLQLPEDLPPGYYFLEVSSPGNHQLRKVMIIHSPRKAYLPQKKHWGLYLGLYSLQSINNQGIGDLADLAKLQEIVIQSGASYLGLLPLHLMDKEDLLQTSPYLPLDRFAFDPIYIPLNQYTESLDNQEFSRFRKTSLVDYQQIWKAKERILRKNFERMICSEAFRENIESFLKRQGKRFALSILYQSLAAQKGNNWHNWPVEIRKPSPRLLESSCKVNDKEYLFQAFLQLLLHRYLKELTSKNKILALDLPLGFAPHGAENWIEQEIVVPEFSVGAPPDAFSPQGQDWGFHPLHPYKIRNNHYQHFISLLRFNMQYAGFLRFDHILSLKRLFWIPQGAKAHEGLYVKYPTQELLSILTLESKNANTAIIGEDLGTVPSGFRKLLQQHNVLSTRVFYFEVDRQGFPIPPEQYPPKSIFLFNTHDMPPLRGFLKSQDLKLRRKLKILEEETFVKSLLERKKFIVKMLQLLENKKLLPEDVSEEDFEEIFQALVAFGRNVPSLVKALSLEDLLGKTFQPNLPGTTIKQYPNWRKKHRINWETLRRKIDKIANYWNEPKRRCSQSSPHKKSGHN